MQNDLSVSNYVVVRNSRCVTWPDACSFAYYLCVFKLTFVPILGSGLSMPGCRLRSALRMPN